MTATVSSPANTSPFFATENPDCPDAEMGRGHRQLQYWQFSRFAEGFGVFTGTDDFDLTVNAISQSTGMGTQAVKNAMSAYARLSELPDLLELQEKTYRLDLPRLIAIDTMMSRFGEHITDEITEAFDTALVEMFTPKRMNQRLPSTGSVTNRLKKLLAQLDASINFDDYKRKKREENGKDMSPGMSSISFGANAEGLGTGTLSLKADTATMAAIRASIEATARDNHVTLSEAAVKLLTGEVEPSPKAVVYAYKVPDNPSVLIPPFGWTDARASAVFDNFDATEVDLTAAGTRTVNSYAPPDDIKAFVRARDGTCIWPDCETPSSNCQLDHRIPFGEGGPTTASNLYSLCHKHHNIKTDRRAFYIPDPVTGEIIWLFDDGTYSRVEPNGILEGQITPVKPRWRRRCRDWERLKRRKTRFYARCHTVMDAYEKDLDYNACITQLEELEAEYDLHFPFHPVPLPEPPPEDLPPDPADDTPTPADRAEYAAMR